MSLVPSLPTNGRFILTYPLLNLVGMSLRDIMDLAVLVEHEAKARYETFARQMDAGNAPKAAIFFRKMVILEGTHADTVSAARTMMFGNAPSKVNYSMLFDVEAPDHREIRVGMTHREALLSVLRVEQRAEAFFAAAHDAVSDAKAREIFAMLRNEETAHVSYVEREIRKLPT